MKYCSFPFKDKCRLKTWLRAIKRQDWTPSKYDRICNAHFTANDYWHCPDVNYTHLKLTAVPSIFPSSIKSKRKNRCKMKIDNENKKNEIDKEKNSNTHERNLTNIHTKVDSTKEQNIYVCDSHINIKTKDKKNIENVHTIIQDSNVYNVNSDLNLKTCDPGTVETEEPCMISSSIIMNSIHETNIEENQINDYMLEYFNYLKLQRKKKVPTRTEVILRHKIRVLQQKLRRRDAKIMYLQRILTNLKQKV